MSLLTSPIKFEHITREHGFVQVQCQCCQVIERATRLDTHPMSWLHAANHIGWRHVASEAFDIDVVCPDCVSLFNNPKQKPYKPAMRKAV
ncbi:hypothetical protein [Pseudoalteromonas sp. S16_S37]|uniref:hypothetical protein n=1 Tax=Pseudoalteromonas sp. S16_S37 TaxID=2720228 RepID=UPI0016819DB9|nr:hypothetical protein [Pseudoalteromonas sp. S16_S37]MBD1584930.1 hypothetical protein [Pseudoalteromonas sp. S16_S37]